MTLGTCWYFIDPMINQKSSTDSLMRRKIISSNPRVSCYQNKLQSELTWQCQRTTAASRISGSDVSVCLCWYAESCCIKLSRGCSDCDGEGIIATGQWLYFCLCFFIPSFLSFFISFILSFFLSYTCVSSSSRHALDSGVHEWVSPWAVLLTSLKDRFWFHFYLISLTWMLLKAEVGTQWT